MFGASRSVVSSMPARKRSGKSARTWKSSLRSVCLVRSAIFPLFRSEAACARNLSTRSRSSALNCPRSMAIPCRRASFASSDGDVGPPGPPGGGRGDGEGDGVGDGVGDGALHFACAPHALGIRPACAPHALGIRPACAPHAFGSPLVCFGVLFRRLSHRAPAADLAISLRSSL